jgi:hypothetical protein
VAQDAALQFHPVALQGDVRGEDVQPSALLVELEATEVGGQSPEPLEGQG